MVKNGFLAKISVKSYLLVRKVYINVDFLISSFWLGFLNPKSIDTADEYYYSIVSKKYQKDEYNASGLFDWEKEIIEEFFHNKKEVLLIAAGGGRETLALLKMGFKVDAFECNLELGKYGNDFLKRQGYNSKIEFLNKNEIPSTGKRYDGIIIGWGAYTHMMGSRNRINFLNGLKSLLRENGVIFISFYTRNEKSRRLNYTYKIANFLRTIRFAEKVELGDDIDYNFVHNFSKNEIIDEITKAGLKDVYYSEKQYGSLVMKSLY